MKTKQGKSKRAAQDELNESDAWLMVYTTEASNRQRCGDFVQEIRQMPRAARRKISSILTEINCPDGVDSKEPWLLASKELRDRLTAEVLAAGGDRALADGFFLSPEEWRQKHVATPTSPDVKAYDVWRVLQLVNDWQRVARADETVCTINDMMEPLLGRIDWNLVEPRALAAAVRMILENTSASEVADVANEALDLRCTLADVLVRRITAGEKDA